jgi:hypothetical protein
VKEENSLVYGVKMVWLVTRLMTIGVLEKCIAVIKRSKP